VRPRRSGRRAACRAHRGRIEVKQTLTTPGDLIAILIPTGGFLAAMIWTRHTHVPGTHFSPGTTMLVSVLGVNVVVYAVVTMGDLLVVEREDGTLLRAKAIPNGMLGYLLGKVVNISGQVVFASGTSCSQSLGEDRAPAGSPLRHSPWRREQQGQVWRDGPG
jgi:ABC-2 type transport system permease protein